jgi:hypothetical protein
MRQFYLLFPIWYSVRPELSWSHYRTLIKIEDQKIRDFYMNEAIKGNWSVRELERQIATCTYSRDYLKKSNYLFSYYIVFVFLYIFIFS